VKDVLEQVGVDPFRHSLEKVTAPEFDLMLYSTVLEKR
jgi:hypothetical protein